MPIPHTSSKTELAPLQAQIEADKQQPQASISAAPAALATMAVTASISELPKKAKMDKPTDKPATPEERMDAVESMLGHLIFMLEVEPNFTAEALVRWIATCRQAERDKGIADPRQQVVFEQLCEKLGLVEPDHPESDPAAQQAARSALQRMRRRPAAD